MSAQFLFTSGERSAHHEHSGYGLKRGLEAESAERVALLEAACFALVRERRAMEGELIALSVSGEELERLSVRVTEGEEPSGRPNLRVEGALISAEALAQLGGWAWRSAGGAEDGELCSLEALLDELRRRLPDEESELSVRHHEAQRGVWRTRLIKALLISLALAALNLWLMAQAGRL